MDTLYTWHLSINSFIGISLKLRHIRNGKELPSIDVNLHYDPGFQQHREIPLVKVLPVSLELCETVFGQLARESDIAEEVWDLT